MLPAKAKSLLGLCQRAGKIVSGESMVKDLLKRKKKINLLLIARDASERTKEEFFFQAQKFGIKIEEVSEKIQLGEALGKGERAIIAIIDENFAQSLQKALEAREKK